MPCQTSPMSVNNTVGAVTTIVYPNEKARTRESKKKDAYLCLEREVTEEIMSGKKKAVKKALKILNK